MKIVIKSNYNEEVFDEEVLAYGENEFLLKELVKCWNEKNWRENNKIYLSLEDDDYKLYKGYEIYYG